jgi:tetratricopeptide (TPR) repeat protein
VTIVPDTLARKANYIKVWSLVLVLITGCSTVPFISTDTLMEQGIALYKQGLYDESVAKFEQVIEREPKRYLAYVYIARSLIAQFKWGPAIARIRDAVKLAPNDREVIVVLGEALVGGGFAALEQRDYSQAITYLVEYIQLQPTSVKGYLGLARAYLGNNNYGDLAGTLLTGLSKASEGREDLVQELLTSGSHALASGDATSAIRMLSAYVTEKPDSVSAYISLAKAYLNEGSLLKALEAARGALKLNPNSTDAKALLQNLTGR